MDSSTDVSTLPQERAISFDSTHNMAEENVHYTTELSVEYWTKQYDLEVVAKKEPNKPLIHFIAYSVVPHIGFFSDLNDEEKRRNWEGLSGTKSIIEFCYTDRAPLTKKSEETDYRSMS